MPIDSSVINNLKPLVLPDIARQYSEGIALGQERQIRQQQMQMNQEKLAQEKRSNQLADAEAADTEKARQAYVAAKGDPTETVNQMLRLGVGPKTVQSTQQHFADYSKKVADTEAAKLPALKYRDEQMLGLHEQAIQLATQDPQAFAAQYPQLYATAVKLDPEAAKHLDPNAPPTVDQLKMSALGYNTHLSFLGQEEEKRKQAEEARKAALAKPQLVTAQAEADLAPLKKAEEQAKLDQIDRENAARKNPSDPALQQAAMTAKERTEQARQARVDAETARHNLSTESTAKLNAAIAGGRLAQEQLVNGMKYGPDTQEFWVKQLQDNPDSIKEMPPEFRSAVGKKFTAATGLPLPTALAGSTKTQETAARNAVDGITFIREALKNPEIQANIGPIMGRLGKVEQRIGGSTRMSPEAEALAQELRTRMRYFVFQEGKSLLGGRLPQELMKQLEENSADVKMDPGTLAGALKGAEDNAHSVMDNADKERFGGKMRSREMRMAPPVPDDVKAALKGQAAGVHKLSDGTSWRVNADGSIAKQ